MGWLNHTPPAGGGGCPDCEECEECETCAAPWTVGQLNADGWNAIEFDLAAQESDYTIPVNFDDPGTATFNCLFLTSLSDDFGLVLPDTAGIGGGEYEPGDDRQLLIVPSPELLPSAHPVAITAQGDDTLSTGGTSYLFDSIGAALLIVRAADSSEWRLTPITAYLV